MANETDAFRAAGGGDADRAARPRRRGIRVLLGVPIAIVSTVAVTLGIAQPADAAPPQVKRQAKPRAQGADVHRIVRATAATQPPGEYVVAEGDTVSGIAERFGLATAEVLAANGLGWSSLIFPGQRLALPGGLAPDAVPAPIAVAPEIARHIVAEGDTVSGIAAAYGLTLADVLSANGLSSSSLIFPGQAIVLPLSGPTGEPAPPAAEPPPAPAPAPDPAPEPAPPASPVEPGGDQHVVVAGDTLSGIAAAAGLSVAELDALNGLGGSTLIVPGQVLLTRRPDPVVAVAVAAVSMPLTDETRSNAQLIVDVGRSLGVPDQGIVVALAAAAQESGLKNVHSGDLDSLGVFQQRPSQGWGTPEEVLDPVRAATAFYGGPTNPNPGRTLGLLDIPGWESMSVTQAAQAVQRSAHPDHYAKWEAQARAWLSELG
ncbi:LysM repeat protein [Agromyces sp. 3263]|uniref:LysM peptidoglycan-binding domain-containing protein n=1 Tax=Agromyces sp. 3263 TaxID=2817750 RepID=UPI00286427FD|nr:LysM domain-containing protein [Agromyces sp. 3263]MDR6907029.1 LysM repeat protein [Agromyces sp. 3263]